VLSGGNIGAEAFAALMGGGGVAGA
jgi:hypothetical protein